MGDAEFSVWLTNAAACASLKNWECYVLGLDPTDAGARIAIEAPQTSEEDRIVVGSNVKVPSGCGFVVSNEVTIVGGGGGSGGGGHRVTALPDGFAIKLDEGDPSGLYSVKVKIVPTGGGVAVSTIPVEQTVGVRKASSAMTKTAVAVPWGELSAEGGAVCVSNLVKTANLTVGDKLHVYDCAGRKYWTWELSEARVWEPVATYVVDEDGQVSKTSAGKPTVTTVAHGCAVWLERQDVSKPFYLYGQYDATPVETTIVAGTAAEPTWNFIASPSPSEPFDVKAIVGAAAGDRIVVATAAGPKIFTYEGGAWGCDVNVTEQRKLPGGGTIDVVKKVRDTTNTTVPVGTGFMYVSEGGSPTIVW